ncbi:hypothetical protein M8C21_006202, partial [Ambrosia artemisiifolia]
DTISANQSLSGNQTIISNGENFELGFFKPVLLNESKEAIWSTNVTTTSLNSVTAILLDDGNLVLRDGSKPDEPVWQSFDHPVHTWLPGAKLAYDNRTKKSQLLTSWRSNEDPGVGLFSLELIPSSKEYVSKWNGSQRYWTSGAWDGRIFTLVPEMNYNYIYNFSFVSNENESYFTYSVQTVLPFCNCLIGFIPKSENDWNQSEFSSGCVRKTDLECGNNKEISFLTVKCSVWEVDLLDLSEDNVNGKTIYIKVASKDLPPQFHEKNNLCAVIGRKRILVGKTTMDGSLVLFVYRDLQIATKNFSDKLGGGGFGSVFKGTLRDSSTVAVKKLDSVSQGEKQFRTEVSTTGTIQHVNLARLRGFCSEGNHKLLVYEYMPNGSLDFHLFHRKRENVLDWKTRYQIAVGTARGLVYLHEKCRDCIIHCDIKPENILLDADFCPKIADFGLAKLVGRDFSRVLTTMRGTRGYLAPEWLSGVPVTAKADVFSYGMLLFELVHGKRNLEQSHEGSSFRYFPSLAANVVMGGGDILSLLDSRLNREASVEEVTQIYKVAYWCIQDEEDNRPSMSQVEHILEGVVDVSMPPIPQSVTFFVDDTEDVPFLDLSSSIFNESTSIGSSQFIVFVFCARVGKKLGQQSFHAKTTFKRSRCLLVLLEVSRYKLIPYLQIGLYLETKQSYPKGKTLSWASSNQKSKQGCDMSNVWNINVSFSSGADTISANQSLTGNQTIISNGGNFELGFFKPVLLNESKLPIWSTNVTITSLNSVTAVLRDNGNLVLSDGSKLDEPVWQSFDHPVHTWLPDAKLAYDNITKKSQLLTSWRSDEDPGVGLFSMELNPSSKEYISKWNESQQYWTSGPWNGHIFSLVPEMRQTGLPFCNCLTGFKPKSENDWNQSDFSSGCVRKSDLNCGNNKEISFLTVKVASVPPNALSVAIGSDGECRTTCLNSCQCNAYSFSNNQCSVWDVELLNLSEDNDNGKTIYIKVASKDLPLQVHEKSNLGAIIGSAVAGVVVVLGLLLFTIYRKQRITVGKTTMEGSLVSFVYRDLQIATKNFTEKLGGGGFGSVFKGVLRDSSVVAVKKLESISQGEKQFRSEVSTIGTIQHVNLVRLRGGTKGYLAPEWLSGVPITAKADVFSYGMILFELVYGKRNAEQSGESRSKFFPSLVANVLMAGGDILSLLDNRLKREASVEQVTRICKVACWCIQDEEDNRPSMSLVEQILEGVSEVNMPPVPQTVKLFLENTEPIVFFTESLSNGSSQGLSGSLSRDSQSKSASSS